MINTYTDSGRTYLELHARRSPVGHYKPEITAEAYDAIVMCEIEDFQAENDVELFQLGRSGRHICIEDTPRNRRRYASLQRKALLASDRMWTAMRSVPVVR